jgi:hypothetical protein
MSPGNPVKIPLCLTNHGRVLCDSDGLSSGPAFNVASPSYNNQFGELMYVVMGHGTNVYGMFADAEGGDVHWEWIGILGGSENVSAVSSFDGTMVYVGTDQGNIYQLTQPYALGTELQLTMNLPTFVTTGPINTLKAFGGERAFAGTGLGDGHGYVLTFGGVAWDFVGGGLPSDLPFVGLDGPDPRTILAMNIKQVFVTHDLGASWSTASDGLPTAVQGDELHYVTQRNGTKYVYLSTYGWSIWRTQLPP